MFKKRWSDGIEDIYFGKDEFEIKFGCFGGDGGGGGGGGGGIQTPSKPIVYETKGQQISSTTGGKYGSEQTPDPENFEDAPSQTTIDPYAGLSMDGPKAATVPGVGLTEQYPSAVVDTPAGKEREPSAITASFGPETLSTGIGPSFADFSGLTDTGSVQDVMSQAVDLTPAVVPGFEGIGFYTPDPDAPLGTIQGGLEARFNFSEGGMVPELRPFGGYLQSQVAEQRVQPFLEMVANAAYQEFDIEPGGSGGMGGMGPMGGGVGGGMVGSIGLMGPMGGALGGMGPPQEMDMPYGAGQLPDQTQYIRGGPMPDQIQFTPMHPDMLRGGPMKAALTEEEAMQSFGPTHRLGDPSNGFGPPGSRHFGFEPPAVMNPHFGFGGMKPQVAQQMAYPSDGFGIGSLRQGIF